LLCNNLVANVAPYGTGRGRLCLRVRGEVVSGGIWIPETPPIPLPIWPAFLLVIGLVTLAVHFMLIQSTLASVLVAGLSRDHAQVVLARAPILVAFLINFGIPPLLVVQALYGSFFYSGSILIAGPWLAVVFLLMGSYALVYFARYTSRLDYSRWASLLSAAGILTIAFIYSNVMSWMIHPGAWGEAYQSAGSHWYPRTAEATLRWAWILGPALCWMGYFWPARFRPLFFTGLIVSGVAFAGLLSVAQYPLTGGQKLYQWAALGILAVVGVAGVDAGGKLRCQVMPIVALALDAASKVLTRHWIRESQIRDLHNIWTLPVQIQPSVVAVTIGSLVLFVGLGLWMWNVVRKEGVAL